MSYRTRITASAAILLLFVGTSNLGAETRTQNTAQAGKTVRASEVIGMNIYNPEGEDVGEVNDIVLDPNTGKMRYAAVTYGGFLGIGDELFAVPWEAFQCTQDPEDPEEHRLTLDVSKEQLEGAQGFNQDNWPNFADPNFAQELDKRYRVNRNRDGSVNVDVSRRGVGVDVNRQNRTQ